MQVLKNIKHSIFLTTLALCFGTALCAQSKIGVQAPPFKNPVFVSPTFEYLKVPNLENSPTAGKVLNVLAAISNLNRFENMPFFCRIEYQSEQAARFPVKFRLGDIQYVDRLEQKVDWELGN